MRIWGGLPTTGQRRRHQALAVIALEPARRAQITPPFPPGRAGRRRHRPPAGGSAGPAAAGTGREPGALRADVGYLAGQLARAAPASTARSPSAPGGSPRKGRLPDGATRGRLARGGYVAVVPAAPGGPVDGPVR